MSPVRSPNTQSSPPITARANVQFVQGHAPPVPFAMPVSLTAQKWVRASLYRTCRELMWSETPASTPRPLAWAGRFGSDGDGIQAIPLVRVGCFQLQRGGVVVRFLLYALLSNGMRATRRLTEWQRQSDHKNEARGSSGSLSEGSIPPRATTSRLTATPLALRLRSHYYKPPAAIPGP